MKRIAIRSAALALLVLLALFFYFTGKGHSLLLDNKTVTLGGVEYAALNMLEVKVDRGEDREIFKRDRIKEDVVGQGHKITVTYLDKGMEKVIEEKFRIRTGQDMYLISLPALIGGSDQWLEPFDVEP
ncbi:DUF6672 family protein [Spirochaeta isovalerica]|uniref:Uncharacterized protein n=1 Tax=Spirochaeta isovalerica TaxID=150 RepID=A0A841RES5_9SPIO|nr:DUF6672 family protein [Spirochaeta isovalerica]MBB6481707.1 hypothetical protein [Spirochaeta isovalerica]